MEKKTFTLNNVICCKCGTVNNVTADIDFDALTFAPELTASNIEAKKVNYIYEITSKDIAQFILDRARELVPNIRMQCHTFYCERKRKDQSGKHRSYATMRVAFSDEAMVKTGTDDWYERIGSDRPNIKESLFNKVISRYMYNLDKINAWLGSYDMLSQLEEDHGMTEGFIRDIKEYTPPKKIKSDNDIWVFTSIEPIYVIAHMLSDPNTGKLAGSFMLDDVFQLSDKSVQFNVRLDPRGIVLEENPHVRQILMGEEKRRK